MIASVPRFVLYKTSNRGEYFARSRSDGHRVLFGFSSREKADRFHEAAGLADEWEPAPFDPANLQAWLQAEPATELLALDSDDPAGELQAVEVGRAVRAIESQNREAPVQVEYRRYPADRGSA